jgi:hypothetical protein
MVVIRFLVTVFIVASGPVAASSQTSTATITGTITDPSGAALGDVRVTAISMDRNTRQSTLTNGTGSYVIPALMAGDYEIEAELPGFISFKQRGVTLQVNQIARIDLHLEIGTIEETIQVTAAAPLLETETAARGSVIDRQKILELPLNGRDYNQLALLSPGVAPATPRLVAANFKGGFNVNGNRVFSNAFLLDGVDNLSYSSSFRGDNVQIIQPSIEALQEFKVQTNGYSAEFGRNAGAIVNATIRSGGNSVRGTAYEFLRNDALDANNFFSNAFGSPKPIRQRNQFGAAIGGPVVRGKTFWFGDYEGLREREGTPYIRSLPTPSEKAGIFDTPVVDPFNPMRPEFSRDGTGHWIIPRDRWDPVAAKIIDLIPDPNVPGSTLYASTPVNRTRSDQFDVRLDHQLSENSSLFGRYSFADSNIFRPAPLPGLAEGSFSDMFGSTENRSQGLAIGMTHTFTPRLTGDFRFGWTRGDYFVRPPNSGIDGPAQVGLRNVPNDPEILGGLPKIVFQEYDAIGRHTSTPQSQTPRSWNPRTTFSLHEGQHFLKFGFEYLHVQTGINDLSAPIGAMGFVNRFTGRSLGDFLLGLPSQLALTSLTVVDQRQRMYFGFLQDDFKVIPVLTFNVGVRYEYATPPIEKENRLANFDPATGAMRLAKDGSLYDRTLIHPDRNNWAPRFGFSYSPRRGWALRGAYGVFYSHTVRQGREGLLGFNPPFLVDNLIFTNAFGPTAVASAAVFRLSEGYPQGLLQPAALSPFVLRRGQDPNQRTPYSEQFSFGIQREVTANLLVDVSYVGNKGTKLPGFRNINAPAVITNPNGTQSAGLRPYPTLWDIQWMENRVLSSYNALQVGMEKRFSSGLSASAGYTWGKALTESPDHLSTSAAAPGIDTGVFRAPQNGNNLKTERGPAEFDVKHRLAVSYVYELPLGRNRRWGQSWNAALNHILGGWQISGIHVFQSGLPLTPDLTGPTVLNLGAERIARPNLVGNPELPSSQRTVDRWFNTAAFVIPTPVPQAFGNSGVGVVRGPGMQSFDFSVAKKIAVSEQRYLQFRAEFFNAFNHANFNPPDIRADASTFGRILSAGNGRIVQFALKLYL